MVVSALHAVGQSAAATVPMPGPAIMAAFDTVHLEARMSCQGSFDSDCDMWDHVHTVAADCWDASGASLGLQASAATRVEEQDVAPNEIGRWITPYRRRVGHWLTPVTPWLAVLGSAQACNFTLAASDNGHPWVFDLLLRFTASGASAGAPRPHKLVQLFNTSELSTFDSTYNQRPTLHVQAPAGGARSARLSAIITGHGTMEFAPSRHVFVVNGQEYNVTYLEPLNQWGCSDKVSVRLGEREAGGHHLLSQPSGPARINISHLYGLVLAIFPLVIGPGGRRAEWLWRLVVRPQRMV